MDYVVAGIIFFIIIYLFYYLFIVRKQKRYNYKKLPAEVIILQEYYKIDIKKIGYQRVLKVLNFVNALMLTILVMIVIDIKSVVTKILLIAVLMIPTIWFVYYLVAKYLKRLEEKRK